MRDSFQREINYLRVSVTDMCNFRCSYCMPKEGIEAKSRSEILSLEELYHVIHTFVEKGVTKVRLTGGEPLLRKNLIFLIESIAKIEKINDLAMTTNGYLLKEYAESLKKAGLSRINMSLDTLNRDKFQKLANFDGFPKVLEGFEAALEAGLKVKINSVLMKGINDDEVKDLARLTEKYPIDVRFIELMPIGSTKEFDRQNFLSCDYVLETLNLQKIEKEDPHSPAELYKLPRSIGRVGLIRPMSQHFCHECNRIRLTSDGKIKPCLHSDDIIDVLGPLRKGEDIRPFIDRAINLKPERHHILEGETIRESMNRIGG